MSRLRCRVVIFHHHLLDSHLHHHLHHLMWLASQDEQIGQWFGQNFWKFRSQFGWWNFIMKYGANGEAWFVFCLIKIGCFHLDVDEIIILISLFAQYESHTLILLKKDLFQFELQMLWTKNHANTYIYIYVYLITLYIYIHHYIPVYTHIPLMSPYISSPFFFSQKKTTPPKTGRWSRAVERCRDLWWWALVTWLATKNRTDGTPQMVVNSKGIPRKFQGKSRLVKYYTYSLVKIPVVSNVFLKIMFTPYCTWGK